MSTRDSDASVSLSFSQAQGYAELPQPLKLEVVSGEARIRIWNSLYDHAVSVDQLGFGVMVHPWTEILLDMHRDHFVRPLDAFHVNHQSFVKDYKLLIIRDLSFNALFDLLEALMRHQSCPQSFVDECSSIFETCRLAYAVNTRQPISIFPAATAQEGKVILGALAELQAGGLAGAVAHLRQASQFINQSNWSDSIRESIHAVESVARRLDSRASSSLGPALASLERQGDLHPALKGAFSSLYGYTSDEEGIRHALLETEQAAAERDEAVFMLGACASFASYLSRKHNEANK